MFRLSSDVISALRTDVTITSAAQCITELVLNSIDAKATSIAVRVDLNLYKVHVIDNGCGLSENDLSLLGNRYMTSKCHSLNDLRTNLSSFGFRGEALASLCEVAGTVMITSRLAGSNNTYCKFITKGCHRKVVLSSRPRPAQGTTILVGDFLYNRPVRRYRIKAAFELEEIKMHLEHIALIHPQVSLSLRDDASGQVVLETKKSSSIVDTFSSLYGPAIAETLCAVKGNCKSFEVSGYISKEAYANKSLQFIYINKRLLIKSKLHKLVNSIMGRSSILKVNNVPHNPICKDFNSAFFLAMSPPKRTKQAVYILNIKCPYTEYDITMDPKKTIIEFRDWDTILNCIETLLRNFLEPHVTPDTPEKGSSLFDEIDRLAREDAVGKGGDLDAHVGTRTILSLPARRDPVVYTPPSQYTLESTVVSSDHAAESTIISVDNERDDLAPRTSCSENPCPTELRGKSAPKISSEDPFPAMRTTHRNHEFDTTSQEDTSTVSTKDFLTLFRQPVLHKKLKHRNPQTKLPVGDPLHFDLNYRRVTNMMLPVMTKNNQALVSEPVEIRKRNLLQGLQRFSMEKGAQLSAASNDTANYHTPINASVRCESKSKESLESLADLPYSRELVARFGTPDVHVTPSCAPAQTTQTNRHEVVAVEKGCMNLGEIHHTNADGLNNLNSCNELENPQRRTERDRVSRNDDHDFPAYVPQKQTLEKVLPNIQEKETVQHTSQLKTQAENQSLSTKMFISSEDFIITPGDIFENPRDRSPGFHPNTSLVRSLNNSKGSNAVHNSSSVTTEKSSLETESGSLCCAQPEPCAEYAEKVLPDEPRRCFIDHNPSSEDLCHLNYGPSSAESEEFLKVKELEINEGTCALNIETDDPLERIPVFQPEVSSDVSHSFSSVACDFQEQNIANTRKRNVETHPTSQSDEPLRKIISLENSYFRYSDGCSTREKGVNLREKSPVKVTPEKDATSELFPRSCDSCSSSKTDRHDRRSVFLNCSIDSLVAVLSPKLNRILFKDSKIASVRKKSETPKSNEQFKPFIPVNANVPGLTDPEFKITDSSREETGVANTTEEAHARIEECSSERQSSDEDIRLSSSCVGSLIAGFDKTLLAKQAGTSDSGSMEFETQGATLSQLQNTDKEFGISSSRDQSLMAVYDQTMLENRDGLSQLVTLEVDGMEDKRTEKSLPQPRNTDEGFGALSSRDEYLMEVYDQTMLENHDSSLPLVSMTVERTEDERMEERLAQSQNTDEYGISSSRDESLIAVYDQTMLNRRDCTSQSVSLKHERTEESLPHSQSTDRETGTSSFHEKSLIAVYDKTMSEIANTEVDSHVTKSDCLAVCGQDVINVVNKSSEKAGNVKDGSDDSQFEDKVDHREERADEMDSTYSQHAPNDTEAHKESFKMEDRCRFLPKGLSPLVGSTIMSALSTHSINTKASDSNLPSGSRHFENQAGLETVKWPNRKPGGVLEESWPFLDQLLASFEPEKEAPVASAMIQDQSNAQIKVYNVCYPYTFSKDIFNNLKVIGQLDRKFIVTIAKLSSPAEQPDVVVLFDQHAVHERIRVERLTKEYRESGAGIVWRSAPVHPALPLSLSAREVRVMTNCSDKMESLGLRFSKYDSHSVRITGVPTCLLLREDREVHGRGASVLKSHLESLIREEVDALVETRGAGVEQPAIIRNVIASEACRGAVKFGHILEATECRAFLHNLSRCDVPFQCAHGRPALTPIADLSHLRKHNKTRKPNLWKLRRT